ncbi:hypothetical protein EV421DRAFT_540306 [Armillaria borealis]|uniref:Uncharacterized protein n=1 Tax=Armillaria borealis TaxID=47425 RepID=A0AA39JI89_9AGAR|nr:hypothetical protein EV421DRAFT_540306 [Armillaria borealis]
MSALMRNRYSILALSISSTWSLQDIPPDSAHQNPTMPQSMINDTTEQTQSQSDLVAIASEQRDARQHSNFCGRTRSSGHGKSLCLVSYALCLHPYRMLSEDSTTAELRLPCLQESGTFLFHFGRQLKDPFPTIQALSSTRKRAVLV